MPPDVPILGNGHKHLVNAGQEYAAELTTTDGTQHVVTMNFNLPTAGGVPNLGAAAGFNPAEQVMLNVGQQITMAQLRIAPPGQQPPVMLPVPGQRMVVLAHVTSFRYLGEVKEKTAARVMVERPDGSLHIHYVDSMLPYGTEVE